MIKITLYFSDISMSKMFSLVLKQFLSFSSQPEKYFITTYWQIKCTTMLYLFEILHNIIHLSINYWLKKTCYIDCRSKFNSIKTERLHGVHGKLWWKILICFISDFLFDGTLIMIFTYIQILLLYFWIAFSQSSQHN